MFAQNNISGVITLAEDNSPLPGVSIVVAGSTVGTISDFEGNYTITVPSTSSVLRFTFVGLQTEEIIVGTQTVINLAMEPSAQALDEVIVVGYGTKRRRLNNRFYRNGNI